MSEVKLTPFATSLTRRGCDFFKRTEPKARMVTRRVSEVELDFVQSSLTRRVSILKSFVTSI